MTERKLVDSDFLESIKPRIAEILNEGDLNSISVKDIRKQLEDECNVSLVEVKQELKEIIVPLYQKALEQQTITDVNAENSSDAADDDEQNTITKIDQQMKRDEELARELQQQNGRESRRSASKVQRTKRKAPTERSGRNGFTVPLLLAPVLQEFFGVSELARTQIVKRLWEYIKEHDLQDPSDRRVILCDDALQRIFKRSKVGAFQMNKLLAPMLVRKNDAVGYHSEGDHVDNSDSEYSQVEDGPSKPQQKKKRSSRRAPREGASNSGFKKPLSLSPELGNFLGLVELDRPQVVKRIWDYVKENKLQDLEDKRYILCDEALQKVFKTERLHMFTMNKILSKHLKPLDEVVIKGESLSTKDDSNNIDFNVKQEL